MKEFQEDSLLSLHRQQCAVQGAKQKDISFDVYWAQILQESRDEPKQGEDEIGKTYVSGMAIFCG